MRSRFRFKDDRHLQSGTRYEQWSKSTCAVSPVWTTYYTVPDSAYRTGSYKHMNDIVGNAPNRKLPPTLGYKFNPMSSAEVIIEQGTGSSWIAENNSSACAGVEAYKPRYRRTEGNLTLGRQFSGFSHPIDATTGAVLGYPTINSDLLNRARSLAVTEVWSKRGRGASSSNLYESLAEVDKTLHMLNGYLTSARKIAEAAKKRNPRLMARELSSTYLMTRYGFIPTVSDIFNTLLALESRLGIALESTRSKEVVTETSNYTTFGTDAGTIQVYGAVTSKTVATVRALSLDQYNRTLIDALGLSPKNLLTLPWELLSNSFVYDWFANIGDFLGAITPTFGLTQIGSTIAITIERTDSWAASEYGINPGFTAIQWPGPCTCKRIYKTYYRSVGLDAPSLVMKLDFKFDGLIRCLDALSLFTQRVVPKR